MFDLDQQIDRWKSAFAKQAACSGDELLELESHLREEIAVLVAAGRSEQEAFGESVARLGDPTTIGGEFAKNEGRFVWDGMALQGNSVMVVLAGLAAMVLGFAAWMAGEMAYWERTSGRLALPIWFRSCWLWWERMPSLRRHRQIGPDAVPRSICRTVPVSAGCRRAGECAGSHSGRRLG